MKTLINGVSHCPIGFKKGNSKSKGSLKSPEIKWAILAFQHELPTRECNPCSHTKVFAL